MPLLWWDLSEGEALKSPGIMELWHLRVLKTGKRPQSSSCSTPANGRAKFQCPKLFQAWPGTLPGISPACARVSPPSSHGNSNALSHTVLLISVFYFISLLMVNKFLFVYSPLFCKYLPRALVPNHGRAEGAGRSCGKGIWKQESLSFGALWGDFCFSGLFPPCAAKQIHKFIGNILN